jgi:Vitamin-D-receptor interacting Mediator subunit 4
MSNLNLKEGVTEALQEYTTAIKQLFDSFVIATRTDPTTPQHVFAKLIERDNKLQQYVAQRKCVTISLRSYYSFHNTVEEHQAFQEKLAQLSREMAVQDDQIMELASNLKTVEHNLYMNIQNERDHIQTIKNSVSGMVCLHASPAHIICNFVFQCLHQK